MSRRWRPRILDALPPTEYWADQDLLKYKGLVPSEVDDRKVVLPDATNHHVLSLLDSSFRGSRKINLNHYVFDEDKYRGRFIGSVSLGQYRNLVPLTRYLPVDIHNLFTYLVAEPPMPEPEVMAYSIEAWRVASSLFKKAADISEVERWVPARQRALELYPDTLRHQPTDEDVIGQQYLASEYERRFSGLSGELRQYEGLPVEFKPVILDVEQEPRQLIHSIVASLGSVVTPQTVRPPLLAKAA